MINNALIQNIMKPFYKKIRLNTFVLLTTVMAFMVSCGTYQNTPINDGIYGNDFKRENSNQKIVVVNQKEYDNYEDNYFTKKLVELDQVDQKEIFTDVDNYYSDNNFNSTDSLDVAPNYNSSQPWGYEDNNTIVNINVLNDPFWYGNNWGWGFNNWGWGFNNNWVFNRWGNPYWGFNPYWNPYFNSWGWNGGFYNPYFNNWGWNNNRFYRNYRYGRRPAYSYNNRRNVYSTNSRYNVTGRRTSSPMRQYSNTYRRSTILRGNSSSSRRSATIRRSSRSNNEYRPTRRSSSRNNTYRRSSTSSSNSRSTRSSSSSRRSSSSTRGSSSSRRRGN